MNVSMSDAALSARYDFAVSVAQQAGAVAMRHFRRSDGLGIIEKGPQDLVTAADHAIDALIRNAIQSRFPDDGILTEESGGDISAQVWVVDPIDGTGNFARGIAGFAISIAFSLNGDTRIGVVFDPVAEELFVARRGHGAFCNGERMRVSTTATMGRAAVEAGYSRRTSSSEYLALMARLLDAGCECVQFGSAARGLAQVAAGRIDGYVEAHLFAWDVLAGLLLVEEAGGDADPFPLEGNGQKGLPVRACTRGLARQLQEAVNGASDRLDKMS